tara:strand:- start:798 stop:1250 length:453 start_codon:yes stop_codon:yes gene_type:complete
LEIKEGHLFPTFKLLDQNSNSFDLLEFLGKEQLVIYFYPKNETYGCTKQACKFRDEFGAFLNLNCKVIGISNDTPESHKSFIENHQLPFTLLSDKDGKIRRKLKLPSDFLGLVPGRITFVINKKGVIVKIINSGTNMNKHIYDALKALED